MKLTFKVRIIASCRHTSVLVLTIVQDLKQQKFVVEAEPSETVRLRFPSLPPTRRGV